MPYKILLVDDDKDFRNEFIDYFSDYEIAEAGSGEEALVILKRPNEIDLVILDVNMPGASGTEVLKKIKTVAAGLPVIILTSHSSEDVAIEALKGHADDYLEKPIDVAKTKEIIEDLLQAKTGAIADLTDKIEKVKHFVERNCYKKMSLKDAAEAVSLSPKYLSRIFQENTGMRFSEYRIGKKVNAAKDLLMTTKMNINEVAYKMGYQNPESFIRIFKDITGQSPSAYRKKYLVKKNRAREARKRSK